MQYFCSDILLYLISIHMYGAKLVFFVYLHMVKWFAQDCKVSSFAHGSFYLQQTCLIQLLLLTSTLQKEKEKRLHNEFLIYLSFFLLVLQSQYP